MPNAVVDLHLHQCGVEKWGGSRQRGREVTLLGITSESAPESSAEEMYDHTTYFLQRSVSKANNKVPITCGVTKAISKVIIYPDICGSIFTEMCCFMYCLHV